jgi:hypothetical protein
MGTTEQMDFPKPVRVVYPSGDEESAALATGESTVHLSGLAMLLELDDMLIIDGVARRVTGISHRMEAPEAVGETSEYQGETHLTSVVRHRALSDKENERLIAAAMNRDLKEMGECPEHRQHATYTPGPDGNGKAVIACCETWAYHVKARLRERNPPRT